MPNFLALETSTDACSVALLVDGRVATSFEVAPRRHNQRIFTMLHEVLGEGGLGSCSLDAIAYGQGPGSFTGLRVVASAVQGLGFSRGLPAVPVCTLSCQTQTAVRKGLVRPGDYVVSTLDAQIGEFYWRLLKVKEDGLEVLGPAQVCRPEDCVVDREGLHLHWVGSGARYLQEIPEELRSRVTSVHAEVLPAAEDLIPIAQVQWRAGQVQQPHEVAPLYIRDEISWKKLSEQGKRS